MDSEDEYVSDSERKKCKRGRYSSYYKKEWVEDQRFKTWIKPSQKGSSFAYCTLCSKDISVNNSGVRDLLKHKESKKHRDAETAKNLQPPITDNGRIKKMVSEQDKVTKAELRICAFLASRNRPMADADELFQVCKAAFPDSTIASKMACGRTKATYLVTNVLGKQCHDELVDAMKNSKFSLIIDESTDHSSDKNLCLVVRYYNKLEKQFRDQFYRLLPVDSGDATSLYNLIIDDFSTNNIPYKTNLVGFASDGANVMFGAHHSVMALLKKDIPNLYTMKCICHSFHLVASYACKQLPRFIEDLVRDIYNYIQDSPKRINMFKKFQKLLSLKPHRLLHPCQTRWLSLLPAVERILEQWNALLEFFQDAIKNDRILLAETIFSRLNDPQTRVYLEFLRFVLPKFNLLNLQFQSAGIQIHTMYEIVSTTYKSLLEYFIKPDCVRNFESLSPSDPANLLPTSDVYIGTMAEIYLTDQIVRDVKTRCLQFYVEATCEIRKRFNFQDNFLKNVAVFHPDNICPNSSISFFLRHYRDDFSPVFLQEADSEWRALRNCVPEIRGNSNTNTIEDFWITVSQIKVGNDFRFKHICDFVFPILILPHSSVNVEVIFSQVNLNKTKVRNRLQAETMAGILNTKAYLNEKHSYNFEITKPLLDKVNVSMYNFKTKSSTTTSTIDDVNSKL